MQVRKWCFDTCSRKMNGIKVKLIVCLLVWFLWVDYERETTLTYHQCSIFIPLLSHEIDAVSIKVGVCGHAKSAQLQEQQQQNCSCLHHVSENRKISGFQLKEGSSATVHPTGRTRSASISVHFGEQLHFFEVCHRSLRKSTARTFSELMLFKCILLFADMLHVYLYPELQFRIGNSNANAIAWTHDTTARIKT